MATLPYLFVLLASSLPRLPCLAVNTRTPSANYGVSSLLRFIVNIMLSSANVQKNTPGFLADFLSLGITAAIAITVGSVVVCVVCVVCIVCLCCKCTRNKRQEQGHCTTTTTTTATSVTINNGAPPISIGGYPQGGYFPMQPVQQHPQQQITQGLTFSPYPPHRNSYSQTSAYSSSHPPPSYHRSFTPTSSKSGRSQHSVDSAIKMHCDRESIITPTHL
ncbi:hypothetical protein CAPTEDRAFT_223729 [Capitella teleta]|uniref:Uncharacterized protein n=1 Tax=Capitella teleta TaxID=283909 RepID=R7UA03_CAPTE|nr:hypothetical protein CAPTEDRAFT_223729 [Capitella teleta]|eukprot:ELT99960.1 hypothetical protein CAPTEDRAFT_223729 [Capitella teleta]